MTVSGDEHTKPIYLQSIAFPNCTSIVYHIAIPNALSSFGSAKLASVSQFLKQTGVKYAPRILNNNNSNNM